MKIKSIYDNGGKTFDRYTVFFNTSHSVHQSKGVKLFDCLLMSENPMHPQGLGQHGAGMLGRHNGEKITFEKLPAECQKAVMQDLN